jgi:glycosyltransferase involved in cell wall biosynthesis
MLVSTVRKLLILNHAAERGGAERVMEDILSHIDADRYQLHVVFFEDGTVPRQMAERGISTEIIPAERIRNVGAYMKAVSRLRRVIREHQIDVVVSWMPKAHLYGGIAAYLERKPSIWWQHNIPESNWLDRLVSKLPTNGVICPSNPSLREQQKLSKHRQVVLNSLGVNLNEFKPDRAAGAELRSQLGIPADAIVFTFVGRLQRWKRPDLVIRAFNRVSAGKNAYLLILGGALFGLEQDYESELQELASRNAEPSRILFLGHQSQVAPYIAASDVMVHASTMEPFGMVIIEAMAIGATVIAVDRGGPSDIITHGEDGFLYDGTEKRLVTIMQKVLDGDYPLDAIGEAAKRTVSNRFTVERMSQQFEQNLECLLSR